MEIIIWIILGILCSAVACVILIYTHKRANTEIKCERLGYFDKFHFDDSNYVRQAYDPTSYIAVYRYTKYVFGKETDTWIAMQCWKGREYRMEKDQWK